MRHLAILALSFVALGVSAVPHERRQQCSSVWGQCGGQGWTGPTCCASGSTCTFNNNWYSQCIPGGAATSAVRTTTTPPVVRTSATTPAGSPTPVPTQPAGSSAGCGKNPTLRSGTIQITSSGTQRRYILTIPSNYDKNKPYRLIFGLHWLGGDDNAAASLEGGHYGLLPLSGGSTIFIAPNGLNNGWANTNGQDIKLIDDILAQVKNDLCIDTTRIFANGFSYGAGMSYSIACSRANVFRGVALYAGGLLSGCDGGNSPIAYLHVHGSSDTVLSISGGRSMRDRFVKNNGCTSQNPPEPSNGQKHICTAYSGCKAGYPLTWCAHTGGHQADPTDPGQSSSWVPAEVWKFFTQF